MTAAAHAPGSDWDTLLHGFVDGELDAANALRCEEHIASCPNCAEELAAILATRQLLQREQVGWPMPGSLRARVVEAIERESRVGSRRRRGWLADLPRKIMQLTFDAWARWSLVPSLVVLAASIMLFVGRPGVAPTLDDDLVAGHVRSLLASHLTDVLTSDRHTVKPWFNGRIDFSPPVVDLASRGFPLVGGRVDYIANRVVAALVYKRNGHTINLFVWPSEKAPRMSAEHDGYNIVTWMEGGLGFWAVSDLNPAELDEFRAFFASATAD